MRNRRGNLFPLPVRTGKQMAQTTSKSYCSVPGCCCYSQKQPYLSFHSFPVDREVRRKWVQAIRRDEGPNFTIKRGSTYVCSRHFTSDDYALGITVRRLKPETVPSLFPWNNFTPEGKMYEQCQKRLPLTSVGVEIKEIAKKALKLDHDYATPPPAEKLLKQLRSTQHAIIKMAFIKEESEDLKIEETFSVKQEDPEEQTKMAFIKEESEDLKIEETFSVKQEDAEEQTKMAFIKEESEDLKIEETFSVKQEDTEEQTDLMASKELSQELNEMKEKCHDFTTGEKYLSYSQTLNTENRNLDAHRRVHTGEKPFMCPQCGKSFSLKGNLKTHMRIHTGEKPFICPQCGKGFRQKKILDLHLISHTGEKPYTCKLCGKSFSWKVGFKIHMRIHTGEKPFICHCGKGFRQKNILDIHLLSHTGEKPFTCPQCGKSFTRKGNLKIHIRVHTGEKPYKCLQCEKSFRYHADLKRHLQTHSERN